MSTLGGRLAGLEYDLFDVISRAIECGLEPEDIERAYQAALAQLVKKRERGRPPGSLTKGKNVEHHLRRVREILISDPNMNVSTAISNVLNNIPAADRPHPKYLERKFRDGNGALIVGFLRRLRRVSPFMPRADFEQLETELTCALERRASIMPKYAASSTKFHRLCNELLAYRQPCRTKNR